MLLLNCHLFRVSDLNDVWVSRFASFELLIRICSKSVCKHEFRALCSLASFPVMLARIVGVTALENPRSYVAFCPPFALLPVSTGKLLMEKPSSYVAFGSYYQCPLVNL